MDVLESSRANVLGCVPAKSGSSDLPAKAPGQVLDIILSVAGSRTLYPERNRDRVVSDLRGGEGRLQLAMEEATRHRRSTKCGPAFRTYCFRTLYNATGFVQLRIRLMICSQTEPLVMSLGTTTNPGTARRDIGIGILRERTMAALGKSPDAEGSQGAFPYLYISYTYTTCTSVVSTLR